MGGDPLKGILTQRWRQTETHPGDSSAPVGYVATDFFDSAQRGNGSSLAGTASLRRSSPPSPHTLGYSRNREFPVFANLPARGPKIMPPPERPQAIDAFIDSLQVIPASQKKPKSPDILVKIPPKKTGLAQLYADLTDPFYQFTRRPFVNSLVASGADFAGLRYPFRIQLGNLRYFSSVVNLFPTTLRMGSFPHIITVSGTVQKVVFKRESPIEAFHRTGGYFADLMKEDLPLNADQWAGEGYFAIRAPETRTRISQVIGSPFISVQIVHYLGSPKLPDIRGDDILNHPITNYEGERIIPHYTRPFFNDKMISLSFDFDRLLNLGGDIKATWQYIGWPEDIENPQTGAPIKRFWFRLEVNHAIGG